MSSESILAAGLYTIFFSVGIYSTLRNAELCKRAGIMGLWAKVLPALMGVVTGGLSVCVGVSFLMWSWWLIWGRL